MSNIWRTLLGTMTIAFMLCLIMLVMSGTALARQCMDNGDEKAFWNRGNGGVALYSLRLQPCAA